MKLPLRIATRASDLALWQARWVAARLAAHGVAAELVEVQTVGDLSDAPLQELGVGVFVRAVQQALLEGRADLAVHSYKDLPSAPVAGLEIVAVPERAAVHDVLVVQPDAVDLAAGIVPVVGAALIGTGAVRRISQLRALRPDLECVAIRGNVPTRIAKVEQQLLDGVMLAAAGIDRLNLDLGTLERLDLDPLEFLPAPAQGALALEMRSADPRQDAVRRLHNPNAALLVSAERHLMTLLDAGCQLSLGATAIAVPGGLELHATFEGQRVMRQAPSAIAVAQSVFAALGAPRLRGSSVGV
jgi:hydroxymethylbilane synthase